jgi:hypothetical protein
MPSRCISAHRCASPACEPCAWRYSLRVSRRVLAHDPRRVHALTIAAELHDATGFDRWRVAVRNLIDHRRRACSWWKPFGLRAWLSADGAVRGLILPGSISDAECVSAFSRRWPTTLRPIELTTIREEIYRAVHPAVIASGGPGRYQPIKAMVEPQRSGAPASPPECRPLLEPMAILF